MTEIKLTRRNWRCEKHRQPGDRIEPFERDHSPAGPLGEFPCVICDGVPTKLVARETDIGDERAGLAPDGQPVEVREAGTPARPPTNLRAIDTSRSEYSAVIIQHLETLLERAKRGELLCLTCVIDDGQNWQATSAGRLQKSDALYAFELWKRDICFPASES
jgi:hypothetical protein